VIAALLMPAAPLLGQDKQKGAAIKTAADLYAFENLLKIELTMKPTAWDKVRWQKREQVEGKWKGFTYQKGDIRINGTLIESVGIRKKGFIGSISAQRPALKIKLHEYVKGQSFAGIKRLTLNNNLQDKSQIRQYLSYKWFRRAGIAAPRCNFARVYVNGKYLGIYSNVEPVRKSLLRDQLGSDKGTLYEGTATDFVSGDIERLETKTNKKSDTRAELKKLVAILDSTSVDRADKLAKHVDIDEFLKFWTAEVMLGHWDGYAGNRNNYFVYWHPDRSRFVFLPWGTDGSFSAVNFFIATPAPRLIKAKGRLCAAMFANADSRKRYFGTVRSLLDDWWQEKELLAEVDRATDLLRDHLHVSEEAFDADIDTLCAYIKQVAPQLERELKSPPKTWVVPIHTKPKSQDTGVAKAQPKSTVRGTFKIPFGFYNPKAPLPLKDTKLELTWRGEKIPLTMLLGAAGYESKKPPWHEAPQILLVAVRGLTGAPLFVVLKFDPEILATTHAFKMDMFDMQAWFGRVSRTGGPEVLGSLGGTSRCEIVEVDGKRFLKGTIDATVQSGTTKL